MHAAALSHDVCLTNLPTLMRQASNDDRMRAKLRTSTLLGGNPKTGNDTEVDDHCCLHGYR